MPTSVHTGAKHSAMTRSAGSASAATPRRRVIPKAQICAWRKRLAREQPEQLELLGVGAGEPGLDEVQAELVEPMGDAQLLPGRQGHALPLHPVAQGGVVELDARRHVAALREGTLTTSSHSR